MQSRRTFLSTSITGLTVGAFSACRARSPDQSAALEGPHTPDDTAWASVRAQFATDPGVTYLNNASLGMPPRVVASAVADGYQRLSRDPIAAKQELTTLIAEQAQPSLARFLGAAPNEIVLTRNATEALHLAAVGLDLRSGDEVLITTQEHPSGRRPWRYLAARRGLDVKEIFVPSPFASGDQVVSVVAEHFTRRTRAIAFCHVTRGGHVYPVAELVAAARQRDIATIVDGAQAVGMLPVDLRALGCDLYAASLHKWLLGPMGTGVLYVREGFQDRFRSAYDEVSIPEQPNYAPPGTADLPLKAAVGAAVAFMERIGIEAIERRDRYLSDYLKAELVKLPGVHILSGPTAATSAPGSTIFEMEGVDPLQAVPHMAARGLHIDEHVRDGHSAIRISTHFYNAIEEIDRFVVALPSL